jgi:hypothetical protein
MDELARTTSISPLTPSDLEGRLIEYARTSAHPGPQPAAGIDPKSYARLISPGFKEYDIDKSITLYEVSREYKKVHDYLYHGSPIKNWHSIIHAGLHVYSNTKHMTSGAMHGPGIYLSDTMVFSNTYSYSGTEHGDRLVMGIFELLRNPRDKYYKAKSIYVVPTIDELQLAYIVEYKAGTATEDVSKTIIKLCQSHIASITQSREQLRAVAYARLTKEIARFTFDPDVLSVVEHTMDYIRILIKKHAITLHVDNYPVDAPRIEATCPCLATYIPHCAPIWTPTMRIESLFKELCDIASDCPLNGAGAVAPMTRSMYMIRLRALI